MHTSIIYSALIIYKGFHLTSVFLKSWLWSHFRGEVQIWKKIPMQLFLLHFFYHDATGSCRSEAETVSLQRWQFPFLLLVESDLKRLLVTGFFDSLSPCCRENNWTKMTGIKKRKEEVIHWGTFELTLQKMRTNC